MKVLSKYMFNPPNKDNACEVVAENVHPINTTQLKIIPFARDYSMFSLFNYKLNCCQLFGGMEVTGKNCTLFSNYTMALGYKRIRDEKTYQLSARVFGDKGALAKSFVGNVYVGTAHGDAQNAMAVALEHQLKDGHTKLMFSGLWHLTEPGHATPAFVKGKCDTDGQFALSYSQRFNKNIAGILTVGGNMNTTCDPATMNYGYKVTVS
uniref:Uncharacterized protein n=1 Tax=Babesia bovis TaxID=5865 RepID=S6B582_BABBO|nr:conserved hypothetical protein [Babesia bovis]